MAFCRNCGNRIDEAARYCQHCGGQQVTTKHSTAIPVVHPTAKDPAVAVLLSFVWSGAGQVYAGATSRGIWMIVIGAILFLWLLGSAGAAFIFAFPFWIWSMFDARTQTIKQNQRASSPSAAHP